MTREDEILDVVLDVLREGDGAPLREVTARAKVSSKTLYQLFGTQDDLVARALERFADAAAPGPMERPRPGESLYDVLVRVFRHVYSTWDGEPELLRAYHRTQQGPAGKRLERQGVRALVPLLDDVLEGCDPDYVVDVKLLFANLAFAVTSRFAAGEIAAGEVVPTLERAAYRLTANNERFAKSTPWKSRRRAAR